MIKAILTDIEGTTSSIAFVKDVLFPYARTHIAAFVDQHADQPEVAALIAETCSLAGHKVDQAWAVQQLIQWIDEDRKIAPLKALQGLIWEHGYKNGDFAGHLYDDAYRGLKRWHAQGLRLYVFSSGSVQAQKLLFGHTAWGDITPLFSGYFDTRIGAKQEATSYTAIAADIGLPTNNILFLSDITAELDAASAAGMETRLLMRDGGLLNDSAQAVSSFDQILLTAQE